jgi:hypothetical protein
LWAHQNRGASAQVGNKPTCFFLEENLCELLENTDPPEETSTEEIELPYPAFGLILPENRLWPLLLIALIQPEGAILHPEKGRLLEEIPQAGATGAKNLLETYFGECNPPETNTTLAVMRGKPSGIWGASWCQMNSGPIGENLKKHKESLEKWYGPLGQKDPDSVETTALVLNFLCFLKFAWEPNNKTPKQQWKEAKSEEKPNLRKKGYLKPILIQEKKDGKPNQQGTGVKNAQSVARHWRRGHWHTVLHGKKKAQRTRKWYKPTIINP